MLPHGVARSFGVTGQDRFADRDVLALKGFEIGALTLRPVRRNPNALPRDDEAAEIFEKVRELWIAGRSGDRAVKREIFLDSRFAAPQRLIDPRQCLRDPAPRLCRAAARGKHRRLDLDAGPQFHDLEHLGDRGQPIEREAERTPVGIGRDKRAGALARYHKAVGAQGGDRLAHDRATDAHRGDHFLLGRQFGTGRQLGAGDVRGDPLGDLAAQISRRRDRLQNETGIAVLWHGWARQFIWLSYKSAIRGSAGQPPRERAGRQKGRNAT